MSRSVCIAFGGGCPRSRVDIAQLFTYFDVNGWSIAESIGDADLVIVTACGFDATSEQDGMGMIDTANKLRSPDSQLVIIGCIAGICEEHLHETFDAVLIPPRDMARLDEVIGATTALSDVPDPNEIEPLIQFASTYFPYEGRRPGEDSARLLARRAFAKSGLRDWLARHGRMTDEDYLRPAPGHFSIRVARGCTSNCSYCAIRSANGPLRSKALSKVLAEFDSGLENGHTSFALLAQDLGAWGQDIDTNVVELLTSIFDRDGNHVVRLSDFNIRWFSRYANELIPLLVANSTRISHLLLPIQSGSDRILESMRRGNTASEAEHVVTSLRAAAPDLEISTHVLVGFPGETEQDFEDTLRLLRAGRFDMVEVYGYSDRPGTAAAELPSRVSQRDIDARVRRVRTEFPSEAQLARRKYAASHVKGTA